MIRRALKWTCLISLIRGLKDLTNFSKLQDKQRLPTSKAKDRSWHVSPTQFDQFSKA